MCAVDPKARRAVVPTPSSANNCCKHPPDASSCTPYAPHKVQALKKLFERTLKMATPTTTLQPSMSDEDDEDDDASAVDNVDLEVPSRRIDVAGRCGHDGPRNWRDSGEELEALLQNEPQDIDGLYLALRKHREQFTKFDTGRTCLQPSSFDHDTVNISKKRKQTKNLKTIMHHQQSLSTQNQSGENTAQSFRDHFSTVSNYAWDSEWESLDPSSWSDYTSGKHLEKISSISALWPERKEEELQNERNEKRSRCQSEIQNSAADIRTILDLSRRMNNEYKKTDRLNSRFKEQQCGKDLSEMFHSSHRIGREEESNEGGIRDSLFYTRSMMDFTPKTSMKDKKFSEFLSEGRKILSRSRHPLGHRREFKASSRCKIPKEENHVQYITVGLKNKVGKQHECVRESSHAPFDETHYSRTSWKGVTNDVSRQKGKNCGRGNWDEKNDSDRKILLQKEKKSEITSGKKLKSQDLGMTNIKVLGEKRKKGTQYSYDKYVEKIPSNFIFLKSKSKQPPEDCDRKKTSSNDQCFIIGTDHYFLDSQGKKQLSLKNSQDSNNNCPKLYLTCNSKANIPGKSGQRVLFKPSKNLYEMQCMLFGDKLMNNKFHKSRQKRSPVKKLLADFIVKMRSFYRICKYAGYKTLKMGSHQKSTENYTNMNMKEERFSEYNLKSSTDCKIGGIQNSTAPSQQYGEGGRHWWETNGRGGKNERTDDNGRSNSQEGAGSRKSNTNVSPAVKSTLNVRRSFDVDYRGRRKKTRSSKALRRSISSDEDKSEEAFKCTFKYRDKLFPQRYKRDDSNSSSSEDPAEGLRGVLNARHSRSCERKRTSPINRSESAPKSHSRDISRSRRRPVQEKSDHSSSSPSSSPSRSDSRSRAALKPPIPRERKTMISKETFQQDQPPTGEVATGEVHNPTRFLAKLDTVLSDLVETEKKKISNFGQLRIKETKHESFEEFLAKKRPHRKLDRPEIKKKLLSPIGQDVNPSIQQLRDTLQAVRVKKRSSASGDVIEKHSERFTERLPHNPRILKTEQESRLLNQRCYQAPRRKPTRPKNEEKDAAVDYPSDFYSSEDEQEELQRACKDDQPLISNKAMMDKEDDKTDTSADEKDEENDQCSGSDNLASNEYVKNTKKRLQESLGNCAQGDAGDSGEFSVDSAYTGSRGATPESVLNTSAKPRRMGGSLTTPPLPTARFYTAYRRIPRTERLIEFKRTILNDIKESKLYSDESINCLLEKYKRKCCDINARDVQDVILSIQGDLGVKPRPDHYVYQILKAAEERRQGRLPTYEYKHFENSDSTTASTITEDPDTLTGAKHYSDRAARDDRYAQRSLRSPKSSTEIDNSTEHGPYRNPHPLQMPTELEDPTSQKEWKDPQQEVRHRREGDKIKKDPRQQIRRHEEEDKAWAEAAVGSVAPDLLAQAKEEKETYENVDDQDWSGYIEDLCQQFDIKI